MGARLLQINDRPDQRAGHELTAALHFPHLFLKEVIMRYGITAIACIVLLSVVALRAEAQVKEQSRPEWSVRATAIEACSCPMFCPCYFDTKPASHAAHGAHGEGQGKQEHFCRFNMAYKVDSGHYGDTKLDGAKFWISGDLGEGWGDGKADWAVLTFDPAVTPKQREGIKAALAGVFPVEWDKFVVADDKPIEWRATKDSARATLDGGKAAELSLQRNPHSNNDERTVITNLRYWGAPRNEGFVLMPNQLNATRQTPDGIEPFEFKDTNGFMITWDINSRDVASRGDQAPDPARE